MVKQRSPREKRMIWIVVLLCIGFGYYHLRIRGGAGADMINNLVSRDLTEETAETDALIHPFKITKANLEAEIEMHKQDIKDDLAYVAESGGPVLLRSQLKTRGTEKSELDLKLQRQRETQDELLAKLVSKSSSMQEAPALRSQIAQLATSLQLNILETKPVQNVEEIGFQVMPPLTDSSGTPVQHVDGAPVLTHSQIRQIHQMPEIQLVQYKMSGKAINLFVFLESAKELPWKLYVVSMNVTAGDRPDSQDQTPLIELVIAF